jgi:hypothetical protein
MRYEGDLVRKIEFNSIGRERGVEVETIKVGDFDYCRCCTLHARTHLGSHS